MTTILAIFLLAVALSLFLTPLAGRLGVRFGAIDQPGERKVHAMPIPRCGGLAIFVAFFLILGLSTLFMTDVSKKLILDRQAIFFLLGAVMVFGVGLFDDFHRLGPKIKFLFQIIGASVAFWGGLRIEIFSFFGLNLHFGALSYFVTVFWFVLFINAINIVDGLDGLAAGIAFFTSSVLVILSVLKGEYLIAMLFAALAGAGLGFLRYNFNPASIFMGDGGSYFLGYAIAGLSIMGSVKSQVGAAMLIPMVALGVPLFDTILSPVRRFIVGKDMFAPDKEHIHHKLVSMGFSTKRVVWAFYGVSVCLCAIAVFMVNLRDDVAGLILIVLGAGAVIFVRKLGYIDYFTSEKILGWFRDLKDEAGLSHERRSFLNLQIRISRSKDLEEFWQSVSCALDRLKFDFAKVSLNGSNGSRPLLTSRESFHRKGVNVDHPESRIDSPERTVNWTWSRKGFEKAEDLTKDCLLRLELPLKNNGDSGMRTLCLVKDLSRDAMSQYTFRRIEHLRRTMMDTLNRIEIDELRQEKKE